MPWKEKLYFLKQIFLPEFNVLKNKKYWSISDKELSLFLNHHAEHAVKT